MGLGVVVRSGVGGAPGGSRRLLSWSNGGEGGGELSERSVKCHSCVAYGKGNELDTSPVSLEGRDEGGVLRGLGFVLGVATEILAKSDFDDDEGA